MGVEMESKQIERVDEEAQQVSNQKELDSSDKTPYTVGSDGENIEAAAENGTTVKTVVDDQKKKKGGEKDKMGNHESSSADTPPNSSSGLIQSKQKALLAATRNGSNPRRVVENTTVGSQRDTSNNRVAPPHPPNFDPVTSIMDMPVSRNLANQPDVPGAYAEMPARVRPRTPTQINGPADADRYSTTRNEESLGEAAAAEGSAISTMESGGLAVANRVEEVLPHHLPQAHDYEGGQQQTETKKQQDRKRFRTILLFLVIFLIMITMILVAVFLPTKTTTETGETANNNPEEQEDQVQSTNNQESFPTAPPSNAPTMLAATWQGLPDYTLTALQDPTSPQSKAYDWILNDPNRTSYPEWKILQRFALAVFYLSTGGHDWFLQKDWLSYEVDECSWYFRNFVSGVEDFFIHEGVTDAKSELEMIDSVCDSDGRYMYLIFTENNMVGTLPPELSLLSTSLLDLEVGTNENLGGSIPSQLGLITNLRKFYANRNQHSGQIPTEIGLLTHMEEIELGYNPGFTGSLPSEMGNMEALRFLSVRQNDQMTGIMPTELYRLTNIVTLYIHGLDLVTEAKLLPQIGQLTKLENLKTYPLPFDTSIPTEIGLLTNMLRLNFWKSHITGSLPSELFLLTKLKRLDIDANALTGTIATEFGNFPNLTMTWMDGNRFSGTLPGSIFESWGKLTLLALNNNNLEGPLPTEIGLLTSMEQLRLAHNDFTGHIPSQLGLLNNVTELFLHDTKVNGNIPETLQEMDALEHLTVSNTSLTGSIPSGLCDRVWDMTYTCNEYYGGVYTICYDAERVNFTCSSTDLCGCDACGAC